ncbi:MAG: ABC transporter permease subunit [Verrucomicrobiae bacterium]|nr:ABC transporter permease subunit [Verrucomicrobiae bacterium]
MRQYFIRRFLLIFPTLLGATLIVFFLTRILPGGPVERMLAEASQVSMQGGNRQSQPLSEEQINQIKAQFGFDKPFPVAYVQWLGRVCRGDFGVSTRYNEPVVDLILERLPVSTYYGLVTFFLMYAICVPLGVVKALRHRTYLDTGTSIVVFFGYAIPGFALGLVLLIGFAYPPLEWFPTGGFVSDDFEYLSFAEKAKDIFMHSVLPLICYMIGSFAFLTMLMKNHLLDNLASDFVRTAIAKGLSFRAAVFRHAIRNSLIPIATSFGGITSVFLTGSFLVEYIFDINGIGLFGYKSLLDRDYLSVMAIMTIAAFLLMLGNILSDILVALVDPRVQFK